MKLLDNGIATLDDWFRFSPPMGGEKQWKDGRSAKELARYITSALPNVLAEIEKSCLILFPLILLLSGRLNM